MTTLSCYHGLTSASHRVNKSPNGPLRQLIPLLIKVPEEVVDVAGWRVICMNPSPKLVPEMLNRIQIRGKGRPVHAINILICQKVSSNTCAMRRRIIVLVLGPGPSA